MRVRQLLQIRDSGAPDVAATAMLVRLAHAGLVPPGVTNATELTPAQRAKVTQALGLLNATSIP